MIAADQPAIFSRNVAAGVSSVADGDMRFLDTEMHSKEEVEAGYINRLTFLDELSIEMTQVTKLQASYDGDDFTRYVTLDESYLGEGMIDESDLRADAMVVTRPDYAIFLPLADCTGAIIHDEASGILMVSHLGRHSTEVDGARKSVAYLTEQFGSSPADLKVWLSPAVGKASYPLSAFSGRGLHDVIIEQFTSAGVLSENIEASSVDTATSEAYFSHSEHLAGRQTTDGRFAIVAMMRD